MSSGPDLASSEKEVQFLAEKIVERFRTAPIPAKKPPCAVMLAPMLHSFQLHISTIAEERAVSGISLMRSNHGTLLDALVLFANSTWTAEERVVFDRCTCQQHSADIFQGFYKGILELRGDREEYGALRETVLQAFFILLSVISDIRNSSGEIIKLEKNKKRVKWPSSPSQFMPYGAAATVSAFMEWARLAKHPLPLDTLCQLASCSSSVSSAMNNEQALLPLLDTLFSYHLSWLQQLDFVNISARCVSIVEQIISTFHHIFGSGWFSRRMSPARFIKTNTSALAALYHGLCTFIPLIKTMSFRMATRESMIPSFGVTALIIHSSLSAFAPMPSHPVLDPFIAARNSVSSPYSRLMDSIYLRNQQECAETFCLRTGEQTKSNFKQCSGCRAVRYCSKECQVVDWKEHKGVCKLLKIITPIALLQRHEAAGSLTRKSDVFFEKIKRAGITELDIVDVCSYIAKHTGIIMDQCDAGGGYVLL